MANRNAFWNTRTLVSVLLTTFVFLTACSGAGAAQLQPALKDTSLDSRQMTSGQELPKAADVAAPLVAGVNPAAKAAPVEGQPQGVAPQAVAPQGVVPQTGADLPAQAAPQVDLSLPVEPRIGARAPEFTLQTLDGQSMNLSSLIGRPVVISYWATWCIPCQQELPILQKLVQEYESTGLVVLTVNAIDQDSTDKVQAMMAEKGMNLPVLLDQGATFASTYQAIFFPTTYYVDAAGVIRFIKLGDSTEADLRSHVEGLLNGDL